MTTLAPLPGRPDPILVLSGVFLVVCVGLALLLPLADDEGLLTLTGATAALREPLAVLLAQKFRPAGTLLNMPPALFGWSTFLVWHAAIAAAAVAMLGRTAQRLGANGLITAMVVATSPTFIIATVTGQSNTDGIFFVALALWLWIVREKRLLSGLVLGATPWVRYELAPLVVVLALVALLRREDRAVLRGLLVFPTVYFIAGLLYFGDVLWWLAHPPTLLTPQADTHFFEQVRTDVGYLVELPVVLLQVTPLWAVPLLLQWRSLGVHERALAVTFALTFVAMVGIPFTGLLNFEHNPRYLMVILPMVAIAAGRVAVTAPRPRTGDLMWPLVPIAVVCALMGWAVEILAASLAIALPLALVTAWQRLGPRSARVVMVVAALLALFTFAVPDSDVNRMESALAGDGTRRAIRWLTSSPAAQHATAIYTNDPGLHVLLAREDREMAERVHVLFQFDVLREFYELLDPETGQQDRVLHAFTTTPYGRAAWPCTLLAQSSFEGTLFVLRRDYRLDELYPAEYLRQIVSEIEDFGDVHVLAGRRPPPGGYDLRPALDEPWMRIGCALSSNLSSASTSRVALSGDRPRTGR